MSKDLVEQREADIELVSDCLMEWNKKVEVSEYLKEKLGEVDDEGKSHVESIIDNAINKAKAEMEPKWTKVLLDSVKTPTNSLNPSININPQDDFVLKFSKE